MNKNPKQRFTNDEGIEMVRESFLNDAGEEIGYAEYPYYTPEEEAQMQAEMQARMEEAERQSQLEAQRTQISDTIMTQLLLNQAQLIAALKAKGVID